MANPLQLQQFVPQMYLGSSRLELIRRIELEGDRLAWVAHAATFRVIWGKVDESTDGGITDDRGVRKNLRVALEEGADPADNMEVIVCPDSLAVAQASTTYIEAEPVGCRGIVPRVSDIPDREFERLQAHAHA